MGPGQVEGFTQGHCECWGQNPRFPIPGAMAGASQSLKSECNLSSSLNAAQEEPANSHLQTQI